MSPAVNGGQQAAVDRHGHTHKHTYKHTHTTAVVAFLQCIIARLLSMARCALRWRPYRSSALCGIAILNIVFLVFLHTHRPSADVSAVVEPNIVEDRRLDSLQSIHDLNIRFATPLRHHPSKSFSQRRRRRSSKNYGMASDDFCMNLTRDDVGIPSSAEKMSESETYQWQTVGRELRETFVFSAYYDRRTSPAVVRIIGISNGKYVGAERQTKHCQLWLPNEVHPKVTLAEYNIVPETHDRSYAASLHTCRLENLPGDSIPYAVSLVNDECQSPSNVLQILNNDNNNNRNNDNNNNRNNDNNNDNNNNDDDDHQSPEFNFTVCVTPLNFHYSNYHQLVEMIEVNRLFGAQHFVFYNYSTDRQLDPYIRWYEGSTSATTGVVTRSQLVRVIPWHLPVVVDVWPQDPKVEPEIHYFGQLAALNDCLYRSMLSSRFVVFTDLDELIVPRRHDTWGEMLESITRTHKQEQKQKQLKKQGYMIRKPLTPGAFMFRNVFFRTDWTDRPSLGGASRSQGAAVASLKLNTLLKTIREDRVYPSYVRSKYIVVAKTVAMVGVHSILNFIDDANVTQVVADEDDGLLHHYRHWIDDDLVTPVADDRMQHFAGKIISAVKYVHRQVTHRRSNNAKSK